MRRPAAPTPAQAMSCICGEFFSSPAAIQSTHAEAKCHCRRDYAKYNDSRRYRRVTVYSVAMIKSRRTAAKRAAGSSFFRPATAQIDHLHAATRAKSSRFNATAVTRNLETLFERMYRHYRAGLAPEDLMVEHGAPAPHAASSAELCS